MKESISIQYSSAKLLNFSVNDMLSLAQLNSSKFRKEFCLFDIRDSIQEIMNIQKQKVEMQGVTLVANYQGFDKEEDFFVFTDECRLQ